MNTSEINCIEERILITGVSGLIGRILYDYFTKTYPKKYQVFGLDRHRERSSRYDQSDLTENEFPVPLEKFFQCDTTDRIRLHQIIAEHKIDAIIHLAALLETSPDVDEILRVNIEGTKNVFEAPGVRRIIYASSVRTMFGYLTREPYLSIRNETFNDQTVLHPLTVNDHPPLPDTQTPGALAYWQSKIQGEQMAQSVLKNTSKSIISVRIAWVNIENQPGTTWARTLWFSYRDLCQFFDKALQAPSNVSGTYFAISDNHRGWFDLKQAKKDLGYVPQDGATNVSL